MKRIFLVGVAIATILALPGPIITEAVAETVTHWGKEYPVLAVRNDQAVGICDVHVLLTMTPCGDAPPPKPSWRDLFDDTPYLSSINGRHPAN